jgi:hypothetical protein
MPIILMGAYHCMTKAAFLSAETTPQNKQSLPTGFTEFVQRIFTGRHVGMCVLSGEVLCLHMETLYLVFCLCVCVFVFVIDLVSVSVSVSVLVSLCNFMYFVF